MTTYRIAIRRDTAAAWTTANPTLAQGEFGYETDVGKIKIGDGVLAWNDLPYHSGIDGSTELTSSNLNTINDLQVGGDLTVTGNSVVSDLDATGFVISTAGYSIGSGGPQWIKGTGSPEGVYVAEVGSLYSRTDATADDALWVKRSGTGPTGWAIGNNFPLYQEDVTVIGEFEATGHVVSDVGFAIGLTGPGWVAQTGNPEGVFPAPIGSLYSRTDATADDALYVKETGADGATGWRPVGTTVITRTNGTVRAK